LTYKTDTLCGMFHKQANRYKNLEMLRGKYDKEGRPQNAWASQSWKDVQDEVVDLGRGLVALGLKPGDRVAVFSENRPRWVIADQAIQACGAVGVPLYSTLTLEELSYMLGDSGARMAIVSTQQKLEMALKAKSHGVPLEAVITMGPIEGQKPECVYTFAEIIGIGKSQASLNNLEDRMSRVTPDDIASIVYTSGTSGRQKGAVLTQKNLVSNIFQNTNSTIFKRLKKLEPHLTHLCHLPLCHAYGRTCDYHVGVLHLGNVLVFAESFEKYRKISWKSGPTSSLPFQGSLKSTTTACYPSFPVKIIEPRPSFLGPCVLEKDIQRPWRMQGECRGVTFSNSLWPTRSCSIRLENSQGWTD